MSEQRIIELEMKISHQEQALEELRQALFEHHLMIEKLEKNLQMLKDRFEIATGAGPEMGPANEKPPHY